MVKDISINDYDYPLPEEKIALHPLETRDECKLLLRSPEGKIYHRKFYELAGLMPPGALMVCNDTKVINARMVFQKESGASIELFLLEPVDPSDYALNFQAEKVSVWKCLVGNSKKWKDGPIFLRLKEKSKEDQSHGGESLSGMTLIIEARRKKINTDGSSDVEFRWDQRGFTFGRILELAGSIPIPPYLNRDSEERDLTDYQTIYADVKGSVAAPTAGLHFTPSVFEDLAAHGVDVEKVTLHVGAGTFRPVKSERIGEHPMHAEPFTVGRRLIEKIKDRKEKGRPVIAVGTTTVRTLESLPYIGRAILTGREEPFRVTQWEAYEAEDHDIIQSLEAIIDFLDRNQKESLTAYTSIMIAPGFKWALTDGMVTNLHQPKSTLLLLVSSFLEEGSEGKNSSWRTLYDEALANNYRFLSYGDACFLLRGEST